MRLFPLFTGERLLEEVRHARKIQSLAEVAFQLCSFDSQRLNMIVNNVRKVLDLGAGHGRDSILFASNGIEVEALDYSAIAV
jgi:2-polyprenyl-3-methyl-5-hydroxy-6-metoxy-1,4-benzoquinol methylase